MAVQVFNLERTAAMVSLGIWTGTAGFVAAGIFLHPYLFIGAGVFGVLLLTELYCRYVQRSHAILRNFGLFGCLRYVMESLGPEMRQYWIASDTEERPFSRRERAEVYRYAKDEKVKSASFGTQQKDVEHGCIRHSMFPLEEKDLSPYKLTFGEERDGPNPFVITKPFMISAMSFGSLGKNAVLALSRGARRAGIPINTGEGGTPKHHLSEKPSVIFQMGTAKFGCRNEDASLNDDLLRKLCSNEHVKMVEIKFSQGAKPGKGGLLPAAKVTKEISELRGVPRGQDVFSPPSHMECTSPETTVRFIRRVQEVAELPVGIKFCLGNPAELRDLLSEMKRQDIFPDYIALDGSEGGTGAAPAAFLDHVGMPLFAALDVMVEALKEMNIREKLKLVTSGRLISAASQIRAFAQGADAVYTARGFMLAIGCIQALQCNTDHCPVGITTHNPRLQRALDVESKANRVVNYVRNLEHTMYELLAATGCPSFRLLTPDRLFFPEPQHH